VSEPPFGMTTGEWATAIREEAQDAGYDRGYRDGIRDAADEVQRLAEDRGNLYHRAALEAAAEKIRGLAK